MLKYDFLKLLQTPGETVTADVLRKAIAIEAVYTKADMLTTALAAVGVRPFRDELEVKISIPGEVTAEYPVAAGKSPKTWKVTWTDFNLGLEQAETGFFVEDTSVLREYTSGLQWATGVKRAGEALAKVKSKNIIDTLYAGAGVTTAAAAKWNLSGTSADSIINDIQTAMGLVLDGAKVNETDLRNMILFAPPKAYMALAKLTTIDNAKIAISSALKQAHNLQVEASRDLSTNAFLCVRGSDTAIHGLLVTNKIPLIEDTREALRGHKYGIRQFFATKVIGDPVTGATSKKICSITTVL